MIKTTNEARELFLDTVKTYDNVTEGDILSLVMLINRHIKRHQKAGNCSIYSLSLSKVIRMKKKTNGSIINCFLYANGHYFNKREAISFNQNGFIGFCGDFDQSNTQPFLDAFEEWCYSYEPFDAHEYDIKLSEALQYAQKRWYYDWIVNDVYGEVLDISIDNLLEWYEKECERRVRNEL